MKNTEEFSALMSDLFFSKAGGFTKKDFFRNSFPHYFNAGNYSDNKISHMVSEFQSPIGNIPDNFIAFYNNNKNYLYEDIQNHLIPNMYFADTDLIENHNFTEETLADDIYHKICVCLRIPA